MKKIYMTILILLLAILSMSVSVFAWFTSPNHGSANNLSGTSQGEDLDIEIGGSNDLELYSGYVATDLIYLTKNEFNDNQFDLYGLSSITKVTLNNVSEEQLVINIYLKHMKSIVNDKYSGTMSSIKYFLMDTGGANDFNRVFRDTNTNNLSRFDHLENSVGSQTYTIDPSESITLYLYFWGYFDGLQEIQKTVYHSIVYRLKFEYKRARGDN